MHKPRSLGMTKEGWGGGPPLSRVNSRPVVKREVKDDDPPVSTDDDEKEGSKTSEVGLKVEPIDSSDDDEDYQRKYNMFSGLPNHTQNTRNQARPPTRGTAGARSSQQNAPSSSAGSKRSADEMSKDSGAHLKNQFGWAKSTKSKKAKQVGYGKESKPSSQRSAPPKSSAPKEASPRPVFQSISPYNSPEKNATNAQFKPPSVESSPSKSQANQRCKPSESLSEPSPEKAHMKKFNHMDIDSEFEQDPKEIRQPTKSSKDPKEDKLKNMFAKEEVSQRPVFQNPLADFDFGDFSENALQNQSLGLDPLDEGSDKKPSLEFNFDDDSDTEETRASSARCPMCYAPVDPELLKKHSNGCRMNIKKQTSFCRLHKQKSAEDEKKVKGYPDIDWDNLDSRLEAHEKFLEDILQGNRPSRYATLLGKKVETGQNRTILKSDDSLTPGYYGPRGLRAMTDFIMHAFSDTVRKRAVEDRLVSARGYTGYVQAVLVPELAVRLIMEDMNVSEQRARDILRESIELGEFLHEEARDIVTKESDDEY